MDSRKWAIGVDLGGTKIEIALVDAQGLVLKRLRCATNVKDGPAGVQKQIIEAADKLCRDVSTAAVGLGVGVAGQVERNSGVVRFAPNLDWHDIPLRARLSDALGMPVVVTNDVRAITWGEWLFGAGKGHEDLLCIFVGTGIGGGIVSGGQMLSGCGNTAGEIGHITVEINGPPCTCGNHGCMEALAGGWAIAKRAREAVATDPNAGATLSRIAGQGSDWITAETVAVAFEEQDALARQLVDEAAEALIAGVTGLVNVLNPCLIIFGGGVIGGLPHLVERVEQGVRKRALSSATEVFSVVRAKLGGDAGVIGAAALAIRSFSNEGI